VATGVLPSNICKSSVYKEKSTSLLHLWYLASISFTGRTVITGMGVGIGIDNEGQV